MPDILLQNICCTRCGKVTDYAKTQSKPTDGIVIGYCYNIDGKNHDGRRIKIRVISKLKHSRIIRTDRMKSSKSYDTEFHMRELRCICGKKLHFDKKQSLTIAGKVVGYCYGEKHRLRVTVLSKLMQEPDFDELIEIIVEESDR